MNIRKYLNRIEHFDHLIESGFVGTASEYATRLNISKRTLDFMIEELKDLGFPIKYSRKLKCFIYTEEGNVKRFGFEKTLSEREMENKIGGSWYSNTLYAINNRSHFNSALYFCADRNYT